MQGTPDQKAAFPDSGDDRPPNLVPGKTLPLSQSKPIAEESGHAPVLFFLESLFLATQDLVEFHTFIHTSMSQGLDWRSMGSELIMGGVQLRGCCRSLGRWC
jgi:hypothetical protein